MEGTASPTPVPVKAFISEQRGTPLGPALAVGQELLGVFKNVTRPGPPPPQLVETECEAPTFSNFKKTHVILMYIQDSRP